MIISKWVEAFNRGIEKIAAMFDIGQHEIGLPCSNCGKSMLYYASDSSGSWFKCPLCGRLSYRTRR